MRVEIELNKVIKDNYNVVRNTDFDGTISIVLRPKKRNCKVCGKQFQSNGNEVIYWKGKNKESLFGYFCKKHYVEAKQLLKEIK
tara:strand:- start:231 stop:482 length:252 start_codon:yes stop_codon:yes gene_type:complete